jgi:lipid-A-disaccharide synthase-like uncharacterized protein
MLKQLDLWIIIGLIGQIVFSLRFVIQWIYSEIKKEVTFPFAFWILSIGGSFLLLAYAIYKQDPVFILGQSFGSIIYFRNIILFIKKNKKDELLVKKVS